jgi:phospholipid/cholesterol/gamma-HCH transport system ATP-binding protein
MRPSTTPPDGMLVDEQHPGSATAEQVLSSALESALASDGVSGMRLSRARTSVRFNIADGGGVTLLLDRMPPGVVGPDEPAEIEIALTAGQATMLSAGAFPLPDAAYAGAVECRGPIRKYLEVDPILQRALRCGADPSPQRCSSARPASGQTHHVNGDVLAIETDGLWKTFGALTVLAGIDLKIPEGVVSVVLGPSGTGKSVLLQHLIGLMHPDRGRVLIRGDSLAGITRPGLLRLRRTIGVMFQDGALFSGLNVYDNVAFPLREHTDLSDDEIDEIVSGRLRDVGLEAAANRFPRELSGGMRKRAGLARALVLDPGILLCDEPDSGLDPVRTALIGDLISEQHSRGGGVILVVTHDIALARRVAQHVSVLWQGQIVESGMAADVFASENPFVQQFLSGKTAGPLAMD